MRRLFPITLRSPGTRVALAGAAVFGSVALGHGALAQDDSTATPPENRVSVTVHGKARQIADAVDIELVVEASDEDATTAEKKHRDKLARVVKALKQLQESIEERVKAPATPVAKADKDVPPKPGATDEGPGRAGTVTSKKSGVKLEGRIEEQGDSIVVHTKNGTVSKLGRADVDITYDDAEEKKNEGNEPAARPAKPKPGSDDEPAPRVKKKKAAADDDDDAPKPKKKKKKADEDDDEEGTEPPGFSISLREGRSMLGVARDGGNGQATTTTVTMGTAVIVHMEGLAQVARPRLRKRLAQILDKAIEAGADSGGMDSGSPLGHGIRPAFRFRVDDNEAIREAAYREAMKAGRRRAQSLAKLAGRELGPLTSVQEVAWNLRAGADDGGAGFDVMVGRVGNNRPNNHDLLTSTTEIELEVAIAVEYELGKPLPPEPEK